MERIKKALDRAREERERAGAGGGPASPRAASPTPEPKTSAAERIQYTQTRTVPVSAAHLREQRVVANTGSSAYTDAYAVLRTKVLRRLRDNGWNVVGVTSPGEGEGKSLTAVNLAISMALEVSHTVLLIDADLRNPGVHTYLGIDPSPGLSDYLTQGTPIQDLLVHPEGIDHFIVMPGGEPLESSAEMLASPDMVSLVEDVRNRYPERIVVFDLPPLLPAADTLAFAPYVDSTLLVVSDSQTGRDELAQAEEMLEGVNVLGTVLNKAPEYDTGYGYGYGSAASTRRPRRGLLKRLLGKRR